MAKNKNHQKKFEHLREASTMTKTDDIDRPRVSQLPLFPLLISLEGCAMDVTKGHHKEVFHALYSFSDEEMYKKKNG